MKKGKSLKKTKAETLDAVVREILGMDSIGPSQEDSVTPVTMTRWQLRILLESSYEKGRMAAARE
jgi:hypothetical protein